jgi:hypothetical protein
MASHEVSIASVLQKESGVAGCATLILTTHGTHEAAMRDTLTDLGRMPVVMDDPVLLRIADFED